MTTPHGHFHWNELNTRDIEAASKFYGAVLGWEFKQVGAEGVAGWLIQKDGETLGGAFSLDGPDFEGMPSHWFTYIAVEDVDAAIARVEEAGGTLTRPAFDVPTAGRIAVIQDPAGAYIALIQPAAGVA